MKRLTYFLTLLLSAAALTPLAAQQHPNETIRPRDEDHFQRRRVVSRIDLSEKMNAPLVEVESAELYAQSKYGSTDGIVAALFNGLETGKYLAYDPDDLRTSMTYEEVTEKFAGFTGEDEGIWGEIPDEETDEYDLDLDDLDLDDMDLNDLDLTNDSEYEEELDGGAEAGIDLTAFESVIEVIEDQIFDKNRSDQKYDIQYIRIVWVDPGETLPDRNFICLKYSDVVELLENTQYPNKFNEAEARNAREVFDLRMFNSYVINVSGRGARTMEETQFRKDQMTEYEHNLWSY